MLSKSVRLLFFLLPALAFGQAAPADPAAALQKQEQDLEKRQRREQQKVDQAQEQEEIKLRARERDELARVQRETTAVVAAATGAVATGSMATYDPAKLSQLKFAESEVHNLIENQLRAEIRARFDRERKAIDRKYALERAKLEIPPADPADDSSKQQHDLAVKTADLNAKFQEQYDDLALEQAAEEAKARFAHTTKINEADRELETVMTKHALDQTSKPSAAPWNPTTDPDFVKLSAARDQAKSDLDTALDEVRAKFNSRRTDIDNAKEDETAKLSEAK